MDVKDFYYDLPQELIAQDPLEDRSSSRLLVLDKKTGEMQHKVFKDIVNYLHPGDCLVINDTKVIPARLIGSKEGTDAHIEILLLKRRENDIWETLVKPGKKAKPGTKAMLFGGGIGVPPILQLSKELSCEKQIVVGYRNAQCFLKEDFEQNGAVYVATEDGSVGTKGNVMDAVAANGLKADIIYACGPMPMLRAIRQYAIEHDIPAYISLEERMACGVGACLGCVCKTTHKDAHSHVNNARICTDGPVFEAREVEI